MTWCIRDVLKIHTIADLQSAFQKFDEDIDTDLIPLQHALDSNMTGVDFADLTTQMWLVSSYQAKLVRYLALASAFYDHAKGSVFLLPKTKEFTELDRESQQRYLGAGWSGWYKRLEGLAKASESRINLIKKLLGLETNIMTRPV